MRKSSIRPVPSFARIPKHALERVRLDLLTEGQASEDHLDEAFDRFEERQPILSAHVADVLSRPLGDATTALGFFLSLSIWLAFDRCHGTSVREVGPDELSSTRELLSLDESLRKTEPTDPLETADVIAMEQPAVVEYIHRHIEATLDLGGRPIEAEEINLIYRMILEEVLALSYAVKTPTGFPVSKTEVLA